MDLMFQPLRKYADFHGRARRTEYWLFFLFRVLLVAAFVIVFIAVMAATGSLEDGPASDTSSAAGGIVILLGGLTYLALILPNLAVTVRRLHDANMSGWLVLIGLVPLGGFVLFIFSLLDGTAGPNIYGPNPRGGEPTAASVFA
ncbi:MAG: DUF805 domain-containing protein [Caulobacter sp.]|nr:DUF805 domain-containing protein [Caulobacter sp.]